jgi:protein-tyrosine sulfotransferase
MTTMTESIVRTAAAGRLLRSVPADGAATTSTMAQSEGAAAVLAGRSPACANPVFVLCGGRSGSTLLRFVLDTHPDLACPPETGLSFACAQLANVWSILAGQPVPPNSQAGPPVIPEQAVAGMRQSLELMIGPYLARRGKNRYCDKSLDAAGHADLLMQLFPGVKFICLYRHPMDVIASGMEACPWGLRGYGFERYAAACPGNVVMALAHFWADHAAANLRVEERAPERCHRVRYEDLVADPEGVAEKMFAFLGVPPAPGISDRCFTPERERGGGADYKIWHTSQITTGSVGRGWAVPANMIEPAMAARLNELADRLGYIRVDGAWGVADVPPELRVLAPGEAAGTQAARAGHTMEMPRAFIKLGELLQAGLFRVSDRFIRQWGACAKETFLVIATSPDNSSSARWRVDLSARTVELASGPPDGDGQSAVPWQLVGRSDAWERVIRGTTNLNVALRRRDLRYSSQGEAASVGATRMSMLADLLGVTSWRSAEPA